jgi:hypothetical protein
LADGQEVAESSDEVLAIGYPCSRLKNRQAWPQGVRGFVRQVGDELFFGNDRFELVRHYLSK